MRPPGSPDRRGPAHSSRPLPRPGRIAAVFGALAAVAAIGLGTEALIRLPAPQPDPGPTLQPITVSSPPAPTLPLSPAQIFALLDRDPDPGRLADPQRLASCLAGLGYPASTRLVGAQPIELGGRPAVLLLLPGDSADTVVALAVAPNCSSADTGLIADTLVQRP